MEKTKKLSEKEQRNYGGKTNKTKENKETMVKYQLLHACSSDLHIHQTMLVALDEVDGRFELDLYCPELPVQFGKRGPL